MNLERFITEMPKAEIGIHLEGAFRKNTLLGIAEQNEVPANVKHFDDWIDLIDNPNYAELDELNRVIAQWLKHPEDLTRLVYDLGLDLAKQNVKYAEVYVNPVLHMLPGMSFDTFLDALNDGRDRVLRGWDIQLAWILVVPRDEPRRADDISRWATSAAARRRFVLGFGLIGPGDVQPIGQFERSFNTADKKDTPQVVQAGNVLGAEGVMQALEQLKPNRLLDGWGTADAPEVLDKLLENDLPLVVSLSHARGMGRIENFSDYPLQKLYDDGIKLILSSPMPGFFGATLTDEYLAAVEHCHLLVDDIEHIALNAVQSCFLPQEEKGAMLTEFQQEYERLSSVYLTPEVE